MTCSDSLSLFNYSPAKCQVKLIFVINRTTASDYVYICLKDVEEEITKPSCGKECLGLVFVSSKLVSDLISVIFLDEVRYFQTFSL